MDAPTAAKAMVDRNNGTFNIQNSLSDAKNAYDQGLSSLRGYSDSARNFIMQYGLAEQANAHEIEMWNMQNDYNTPAAQMKRFEEAGLNPMLAYTQGNPGNATSAPGTHVPNAKLTRDQDNIQKLNAIVSTFQAVNGMINDILGTVEKSYDVGIKSNEKAWSDLDYAAAAQRISGFGEGRDVRPGYRNIIVQGSNGQHNSSIQASLDPYADDFSPLGFRTLDRLGVPGFLPKMTSASAAAQYSNARTYYQSYYNANILPLIRELTQGNVDMSNVRKQMIDYQDQVLEMIPPSIRAYVVPILEYLRPFINTSLRNERY